MRKIVVLGCMVVFGWGCTRPAFQVSNGAFVAKEGFIDCFKPGLQAGGRELWCEASAVLYDGKNLTLANDKDMAGAASSVFFWSNPDAFSDTTQRTYLSQPLLKKSQKYEDFARTPDGKYALLTTAFDRVKPGTTEWDSYNALVYWKIGDSPVTATPRAAHMGNPNEPFSVSLRPMLSKALPTSENPEGAPYFKIEGLAATDDLLYFGIREEGKQYDNFKYKVKLLTAPYRWEADSLVIGMEVKTVLDYDIAANFPDLPKPMGLSCIEYDPKRKVFWLLTSLESDTQGIGGYLWWASPEDLKIGKLHLVYERGTEKPLRFTHKSEDLTLLSGNRLFVIHDDDRNRTKIEGTTRQPNQAAYSIVEF